MFLWLLVGLVPEFAGLIRQRKWYNTFLALLLYVQISLDFVQINLYALQILLRYSVWQTNTITLVAIFGTLLVSLAVALWWLRGRPALTIVYAMLGIYVASIVTGSFSERLFGWGEIPSALPALLSPLLYVQAARWILRRDGTALAGLAAGYVGLLAGLLLDQLLQLRASQDG